MTHEFDYDLIGIGFGPANIALAIALDEFDCRFRFCFLEKNPSPSWQKDMMLNQSDIQNHPLRDLVTPRNPQSHYSFTNFLHKKGRLFEHLNLGMLFPFRQEYAEYVCWVADHFKDFVRYDTQVTGISVEKDRLGNITHYVVEAHTGQRFSARHIVVAPGRTPYVPQPFDSISNDKIIHLTEYLPGLKRLENISNPVVCVVGGSQSAVEIILDLNERYPDAIIHSVSRTFGFRLKDTSPFTGEVYFPEFVDRFFNASHEVKQRLRNDLHYTNYSAADGDVLDQLYRRMYLQRIAGKQSIKLWNRSCVSEVKEKNGLSAGLELTVSHLDENISECIQSDFVVLATGFRDLGNGLRQESCPSLLHGIVDNFDFSENGFLKINYDYSLNGIKNNDARAKCFLNGLCESSHGMGDAGSFSLLALRSELILKSILVSLGSHETSHRYKSAV